MNPPPCNCAHHEQIVVWVRGTVSMFATSKDCRTHNNAITGCVKAISARGET